MSSNAKYAKLLNTYAKALYFSKKTAFLLQNSEDLKNSEEKSLYSQKVKFFTTVRILGEELLLIRALFISSEKFQNILKNPTYSEEYKFTLMLTIFPGLSPSLKAFLKLLTQKNHLFLLPDITDEYNKILLKLKNAITIKITTATPLDKKFGLVLLKFFKEITCSNEVYLNISYNPKLLGGFILQYNSLIIDATILKEFSTFFTEI